jgi:hypothetical protein
MTKMFITKVQNLIFPGKFPQVKIAKKWHHRFPHLTLPWCLLFVFFCGKDTMDGVIFWRFSLGLRVEKLNYKLNCCHDDFIFSTHVMTSQNITASKQKKKFRNISNVTCTMSPCSCPEAVNVKWQRNGIRFHCGVGTWMEYVRPISP